MNFIPKAALVGVCALAVGCEPVPTSTVTEEVAAPVAPLGPVTTEAAFREVIVGRRLTLDNDFVLINADGTLTGTQRGVPFSGNWRWSGRYWCHTLSSDAPGEGEECIAWQIVEEGLRATRNRGFGQSIPYSFG